MPNVFHHRHTVLPDEADRMGHANNLAYMHWMIDAAVAHSAAQGWPGEALIHLGCAWVVRRHAIDYHYGAMPGDRIVVQTWVATMRKVTSLRRYRIVREADEKLLASAETMWAFVDFTTGRPKRIPADVAQSFVVVDASNEPSFNSQ